MHGPVPSLALMRAIKDESPGPEASLQQHPRRAASTRGHQERAGASFIAALIATIDFAHVGVSPDSIHASTNQPIPDRREGQGF